jgi:hypothetical protein
MTMLERPSQGTWTARSTTLPPIRYSIDGLGTFVLLVLTQGPHFIQILSFGPVLCVARPILRVVATLVFLLVRGK